MADAVIRREDPAFDPHMSGPLVISLIFHALVIFFAIVGFPYIKSDIPPIPESIPVEIIVADDVQSDKKPPPAEKKVQPQQLEKPPEKIMPKPPQVTDTKPPKPTAPQKPEMSDLAPPQEKTPEPVKKVQPKPVTPPKPTDKPKPVADAQEQQEEFKSLLRNLMPDQPSTPQEKSPDSPAEISPLARFSQQMNTGELQALQQQLSQCWKLMSGARYAEDLIVEIKLFMNPDRSIRDAEIVDQMRYMSDSYYAAAADSAMRAVRDPSCNPLELPPNKYNIWKEITVTFDPREML